MPWPISRYQGPFVAAISMPACFQSASSAEWVPDLSPRDLSSLARYPPSAVGTRLFTRTASLTRACNAGDDYVAVSGTAATTSWAARKSVSMPFGGYALGRASQARAALRHPGGRVESGFAAYRPVQGGGAKM